MRRNKDAPVDNMGCDQQNQGDNIPPEVNHLNFNF